jgi:repressor LexA
MREIGAAAGLASPASVQYQLQALEKKGFIRRDPTRGRALEVLLPGENSEFVAPDKTRMIPLVGRIAAGGPILAEQTIEETFPLPESIVGQGELFMLKVVGDSMINAGILDGDTVIIQESDSANTGEIIVALVDNEEATLKRLRRRGDSIALEAANPAYETRLYGADRVKVQGRLVGLIRRY